MRRPGRILLLIGAALLFLVLGIRAAVNLYTEVLWFDSLGYLPVYWTRLGATLAARLAAGSIAAGLVLANLWLIARRLGSVQLRRQYGNLEIAEQVPRGRVVAGMLVVSALAGWWLSAIVVGDGEALALLAWFRRVAWGVSDPLFGKDLSFYIFSLPLLYDLIDFLILATLWSNVLVLFAYVLKGSLRWRDSRLEIGEEVRTHFVLLGAVVVLFLGIRYWLGRYGLLLEGTGIGGGIGHTDVEARLPSRHLLSGFAVLAAAGLVYGSWRRSLVPPVAGLGILGVGAIGLGQLYPSFIQKFRVEPNQFVLEAPYIHWNLDFTRLAYGIDRLERRSFSYGRATAPDWEDLATNFGMLPLWDEEPLVATFNQIEAIFGYYHFADVDNDRYGPPGSRHQVAIGVREFNLKGLPESARTWQTVRLNPKYIRGMGVVVSPTAGSTSGGEPLRWVRNVDPVVWDSVAPVELELRVPGIYFGETMGLAGSGQEYVIVVPGRDSALIGEPGRDYPEGILLGTLPRLLAFAWKFRDKNLLFSGELTADSRIVFRRPLRDRLGAIAPFVLWDSDAYPVISDGRIVWIVDGFVASSTFPLSRRLEIRGAGTVRYLRNSVKAIVDAVTGTVTLYQVADDDPILETYRRVFPGLIRPLAEMPPDIQEHLRYPTLYLQAQAEILTEYHLNCPEIFYSGQDFWQLPQNVRRNGARSYRPAYTLMMLPGQEEPEFLLSIPFIARERQNMTALLVARNDPPHYGELVLFELPRDQQIPGPTQVAALIEQDPVISPQLSLWRQAGSDVDLGRLRVLPLDGGFLYVQPIFLSARESSIPELARVVVSDGRTVSMAPTLAEAIRGLGAPVPVERRRGDAPHPIPQEGDGWRRRAAELFDEAERRLQQGDWAGFGERWAELRALLKGAGRGPG